MLLNLVVNTKSKEVLTLNASEFIFHILLIF